MRRAFILLLVAGACTPRSIESHQEDVTETHPGCEVCVAELVTCVSTSRDDAEFMHCRDQFAACQIHADLPRAACANPQGADACQACGDRRTQCEVGDPDPTRCGSDEAECMQRFGVAACPGDAPTDGSGGAAGVGGEGS